MHCTACVTPVYHQHMNTTPRVRKPYVRIHETEEFQNSLKYIKEVLRPKFLEQQQNRQLQQQPPPTATTKPVEPIKQPKPNKPKPISQPKPNKPARTKRARLPKPVSSIHDPRVRGQHVKDYGWLIDKAGNWCHVTNLCMFLRDINVNTNATTGLMSVFEGKAKTFRGWSLVQLSMF